MNLFIWFPFKRTFQQQLLLEYPWERKPAYSFVTVNHKKGLCIYLVVCYVYFFQVKNIVKSRFLYLQKRHQMLWSTFQWNYQHLYPEVSCLMVELMLSMLASSAAVERGIKMYLLIYATFLQLGTITIPMQECVIKKFNTFLLRLFFQALCFN